MIATKPPADRAATNNARRTHSLHKMFVQAEMHKGHLIIRDEADDHAQRINVLTHAMQLQSVRVDAMEKWIVIADGNDALIKDGLKRFEATATEQGVAISAFRMDFQGALKDTAVVMERAAARAEGHEER